MHAPRTTIWAMSDLTRTKHRILQGYLEWWLPTMLQEHERVYFLDGFAGPGEYVGGAIGSPFIAIDTLLEHTSDAQKLKQVTFFFIEKHKRRYYYLHTLINRRGLTQPAVAELNYSIVKGDFTRAAPEQITTIEKRARAFAPTFAFIDPFGFSDIPMSHIAQIMYHPHSDILITFMYEEINRFLSHPDQKIQRHFTKLFGTEQWRSIDLTGDREQQVCDLYRTQLQTVGNTKYVCMFRIKNQNNATDYFLVFGTRKLENIEKMKDVFWDIDPYNGHTFEAAANHYQLPLLQPEPDYILLAQQLQSHFKGTTTSTIQLLDEYIITKTDFRRKDREHALKYLEQISRISIIPSDSSYITKTDYIFFL